MRWFWYALGILQGAGMALCVAAATMPTPWPDAVRSHVTAMTVLGVALPLSGMLMSASVLLALWAYQRTKRCAP